MMLGLLSPGMVLCFGAEGWAFCPYDHPLSQQR